MSFQVPDPVREAVQLLNRAGFEAYPVGGCVRDMLLNTSPHDWDLCTSAQPEEMKHVFNAFRTLDTGIRHGTVSVLFGDMQLEITTFRTDGEYADHRHPESVSFTRNLRDDLSRRDFTVNAMAMDLKNDRVIDLFGGKEDLENKVIRCVGEPEKRFEEDALRILRAMRFSARLGFTIEPGTLLGMRKKLPGLSAISRERISQELCGLLLSADPSPTLFLCRDMLFSVIPETADMDTCPQNCIYHDQNVFNHTLKCVSSTPPLLPVRWAALMHDIAKPLCRMTDREGIDHFPGHPKKGAEIALQILERLKLPRTLTNRVCLLVLHHDELLKVENVWPLLSIIGPEAFDQLTLLRRADLLAHAEAIRKKADEIPLFIREKERLINENACLSVTQLALRGKDLTDLGMSGPSIGRTLDALLQAVVHRQAENEKEALLRWLRLNHKEKADENSRVSPPGQKKPGFLTFEKRSRLEREAEDLSPEREERPCYRDGSSVNECWNMKNH